MLFCYQNSSFLKNQDNCKDNADFISKVFIFLESTNKRNEIIVESQKDPFGFNDSGDDGDQDDYNKSASTSVTPAKPPPSKKPSSEPKYYLYCKQHIL